MLSLSDVATGKVYAQDIHPLAIKMVEQKAAKEELGNIQTILSHCQTTIPDNSLDLVIIFDVFHELDNQYEVLNEIHRVLKLDAVMCFSDHHMKEERILSKLNNTGLFTLEKRGRMTIRFVKK